MAAKLLFMPGALSNGLPLLGTSGNRIVDAHSGEAVLLRGVNRSGLEYSEPDVDGFVSAAGISGAEFRYLARDWKCNVFRIPFNQDWVLNGRSGRSGEDYLRDLDRVILWASSYGAYTLLDLQWLSADQSYGGGRNFVAPLPNVHSIELWRKLAIRYREEPAVLCDLFTEPHDPLADDPNPMLRPDGAPYPPGYRNVTMADWQPWAQVLVDTIREVHPNALIFVSGINWGYDLRGFPLDSPNLVYSTHVYPNKGREWFDAFGRLASGYPVMAGEWGGEEQDLDWGQQLAAYFDQLDIGWTAWSWANSPRLVTLYAETAFGAMVRERLPQASS